MNEPSLADADPFYPGLFEVADNLQGTAQLVASHCESCGRNSYPAKRFCPFCSSADQGKIALSGEGHIYAFTHVERPPKSAAGPYVAAYVDMDESVRLFGKIEATPATLKIGDKVQVAFGILPGTAPKRLGYWFVPKGTETL